MKDGTYNITANGDAVQAESSLTVNGGNFDIITEGATTGTSDSQIDSGNIYIETEDDGIHADRNLYINGGEINIPTCYESFEGTIIEVNGGKSFIDERNDAIGAAVGTAESESFSSRGGNPNSQVWFNGGEVEAVSGGDTVDSNGNIYVTGGTVLSLRDKNGNTLSEITTRKSAMQSAHTSPELKAGETYSLYIDGKKKIEVALKNGMNTIGDDGGEFTGGYRRGTW